MVRRRKLGKRARSCRREHLPWKMKWACWSLPSAMAHGFVCAVRQNLFLLMMVRTPTAEGIVLGTRFELSAATDRAGPAIARPLMPRPMPSSGRPAT